MEWTSLDTWIVITGALSAMSCALAGNYLVLRKMSMMGDAISHAVLPGLAVAFLITGSRESLPMLIGATAVGVLTAFLIQTIFKLSRLDHGATMGVIFTTLFALGLILIRQAADHVDLDVAAVRRTTMRIVIGQKDAPHAAMVPAHGMGPAVPAVEIADNRYPFGIRGPDREQCAALSLMAEGMGSELPVQTGMAPLLEQIDVVLAQPAGSVNDRRAGGRGGRPDF